MRDGVLLCQGNAYQRLQGAEGILAVQAMLCAYLRVSDYVEQGNDVGTTCKVLEDLDLALDLLLLDRLEDLDNALLVVDYVDALEDLRVLSTACDDALMSAQERRKGGRGAVERAREAGLGRTDFPDDFIILQDTPA